jgi:hypothetical protein
MYSLALIIFVVSEKKAFEHRPLKKKKKIMLIRNPRWLPPQAID